MPINPSALSNWLLVLTGFGAAFLLALWASLIIWTYRDVRSRVRDPLARILSVLVVAILFLPGMVVYLILRPARTIEDEYQRTLEEEAMLQTIEETSVCPGCARKTIDDWVVCPSCHTKLSKTCHHCGKIMELTWDLCPYCGTPAPGMRRENNSLDDVLQVLPAEEIETPETT